MRANLTSSASLSLNEDKAHALSLLERWKEYQSRHPSTDTFDAARDLGVSELELVASGCGVAATRLRCEPAAILQAIGELGTVMALTRNDHAVIEKAGKFGRIGIHGHVGIVLNEAIDLRLFLAYWRHAYAVSAPQGHETLRSLQFFDTRGIAVHKIYLKDPSRFSAYTALVERFRDTTEDIPLRVEPPRKPKKLRPDSIIDVQGLHAGWKELTDTRDFFKLLKTYDVDREQALRLVGHEFAVQVAPSALRATLEAAQALACPIMVFVGNHGVIEIHSGLIHNLKTLGAWYKVLDEGFSLHLREDRIARAWIVRKPTKDGIVTSLELFAADGVLIAQIFGERKPDLEESASWRQIMTRVEAAQKHPPAQVRSLLQ